MSQIQHSVAEKTFDCEKSNNQPVSFPELMTRSELAKYLRIAEVSKSANFNHVIDNLQRIHNLPMIHIARQPLYPLAAVREWIAQKVKKEQQK